MLCHKGETRTELSINLAKLDLKLEVYLWGSE